MAITKPPTKSEDLAHAVWSMARNLASPSYSGTSLNSDRMEKYIALFVESCAAELARNMLNNETRKRSDRMHEALGEQRIKMKNMKDEIRKQATDGTSEIVKLQELVGDQRREIRKLKERIAGLELSMEPSIGED